MSHQLLLLVPLLRQTSLVACFAALPALAAIAALVLLLARLGRRHSRG